MGILQTAERSSHLDPSENVIFQRHLVAYKNAAKIVSGTVLEIGSGEGYGVYELAPHSNHYIAVDKSKTKFPKEVKEKYNITFIQSEVPPLLNIEDNTIDFVVTFQVIEHIQKDEEFLKEIYRVLKPKGQVILSTPNKKMSLSRNPWHIREYDFFEMQELLTSVFDEVKLQGVFGNQKVMNYYEKNKTAIKKITRFDIFRLQYILPRWMLQIPYDILNRFNRHKLQDENEEIVNTIKCEDYIIKEFDENCLDHFCIATK